MRIVLTAIGAVVLAALASVGVFAASQPVSKQTTTPVVSYGTR